MNWLQSNTVAVLIAVSLLACKNGDELGGKIQPKEESLSTAYEDNLELITSVVRYDSVRTNNSYRILIGNHVDPIFGQITANSYLRFTQNTLRTSFGPNPVADSIYVNFYISVNTVTSAYFYGNDSPVKIKIYELTEAIPGDSAYYGSRTFSYDNTKLLADTTLNNSLFNSSVTSRIVSVKLDKSLVEKLISNGSEFYSHDAFSTIFKGLALISDNGVNQSIIGIYNASITLYYHNYYGLNNLPVKEAAFLNADLGSYAQNEFIVDRSVAEPNGLAMLGTNISSVATVASSAMGDRCFIQNNTGVFTKIDFSSLNEFKERLRLNGTSKILIDRAELVIQPDTSVSINYAIPTQLYAFELNSDGSVKKSTAGGNQYLQNELGGIYGYQTPTSAEYNTTTKAYKFVLTTYIQALLDGHKDNNGLLLGANNTFYNSIPLASLNRLVFNNGSSQAGKKNIRLKIYYTPFQ